jgi:hypothetical protein
VPRKAEAFHRSGEFPISPSEYLNPQ